MEFGLNQYSQLSGISDNTQAFFSCQDTLCESKEAYSKKKKKKSPQAKFNSLEEVESILFSEEEEDEQTKALNDKTQQFVHQGAQVGSGIATKLIGKGLSKVFVKRKSGMFGKLRTNMARRRFAKGFSRNFGGVVNNAAHMGANIAHEKYLKV